jgi:biopolymer transport protein ExbB/TolQ
MINPLSKIGHCIGQSPVSKEFLNVCEISLIREASSGISWLSIISSTAPFIGLFGTVVGILESFAKFSTVSKVSFSTIAPVISEALVATAAGIFVAIFAYTFHQIITRKIYELNTYFKSQIDIILAGK